MNFEMKNEEQNEERKLQNKMKKKNEERKLQNIACNFCLFHSV